MAQGPSGPRPGGAGWLLRRAFYKKDSDPNEAVRPTYWLTPKPDPASDVKNEVRPALRSMASYMMADSEFGNQPFSWRNAPELRSTTRRALGSPMARSEANCVMVRDTVSIVSPR
jgi:hypothetical protein